MLCYHTVVKYYPVNEYNSLLEYVSNNPEQVFCEADKLLDCILKDALWETPDEQYVPTDALTEEILLSLVSKWVMGDEAVHILEERNRDKEFPCGAYRAKLAVVCKIFVHLVAIFRASFHTSHPKKKGLADWVMQILDDEFGPKLSPMTQKAIRQSNREVAFLDERND